MDGGGGGGEGEKAGMMADGGGEKPTAAAGGRRLPKLGTGYTPVSVLSAPPCVKDMPYATVPTALVLVEGSAALRAAGKAVVLLLSAGL